MAFLDLTFPHDVAAGVVGGPERRTNIVPLASGREERDSRWADSRRSWQAGLGIRSADQLAAVLALWEEARGQLHSFRFRDWSDFKSCAPSATPSATDVFLGQGDGTRTEFQLVKRYGTASPYVRRITKPVAGSVLVAVDLVPVASGWSVDHAAGLVTFAAAPPAGALIRAGYLFDVPVRFDAARLDLDLAFFRADLSGGVGSIPQVPLVEVRE